MTELLNGYISDLWGEEWIVCDYTKDGTRIEVNYENTARAKDAYDKYGKIDIDMSDLLVWMYDKIETLEKRIK